MEAGKWGAPPKILLDELQYTMKRELFRPPGTVVPDGLLFYRRCFFFFRQPNLRGPSADRRETLPHDRNLVAIAG